MFLFWQKLQKLRNSSGETLNRREYAKLRRGEIRVLFSAADPSATVVGAGLAPVFSFGSLTLNPAKFVKGMYAAGAKGNFDALAYHPYLYGMKFSTGGGYPESPLSQVTAMRQVMADNGDGGKAIWCTEYGQPTSEVDEATQADYVRDLITTWRTLPFAAGQSRRSITPRPAGNTPGSRPR